MNRREKILVAVVSLLVATFVVAAITDKAFLTPMSQADKQAEDLQREIDEMETRALRAKNYSERIRKLTKTTFGDDEHRVSEQVRTYLDGVLKRSGLSNDNLSVKPVTGVGVRGAFKELGWNIRTQGSLKDVVDLLYVLENDPLLHRVEDVTITPQRNPTELEVQFKYTTLILEQPQKGATTGPDGEVDTAATQPAIESVVRLDDAGRQRFVVITDRDLFRPYIKRPPPKPEPVIVRREEPSPPPRKPETPPLPVSTDSQYRLVGLPSWQGRQDIFVQDIRSGQTRILAPGDTLAEGKIVLIDYRPLPLPDKPELLSTSRVILKIGLEYWAIELGQSLAEKRRLPQDQLPKDLRLTPTTMPAPQAMSGGNVNG